MENIPAAWPLPATPVLDGSDLAEPGRLERPGGEAVGAHELAAEMGLVVEAAVERGGGERCAAAQQGLGLLQHHQDMEVVEPGAGDGAEGAGEVAGRHATLARELLG